MARGGQGQAGLGGAEPRRWLRDLGSVAVVAALIAAVALLPQDTSLSELRRGGILRACIPQEFPPLVTNDPNRPGVDIEIMRIIADELGVRLVLNRNAAIGRELDPRAWNITRANCQIVGGGVVTSDLIRSFMLVTEPHLGTGWAVVGPAPLPSTLQGLEVGVHVGMVGRDRIALSRLLRAQGARFALVETEAALSRGISSGAYAAGVVDALLGGAVAKREGWQIAWLSQETHVDVGLALWKGDMTLSRAVERILRNMREDGRLDAILDRYTVPLPEAALGLPESEQG